MADDERDLVRSRSDIVELVGQRVILKRVGKHFSGLCPFHDDKNPSFSVDPHTGRYRCWSCGESGDVFTWVMKTESVDFPEALQILARRAGLELQGRGKREEPGERAILAQAMQEAQTYFRAQFSASKIAQSYCASRGLSQEVIDQWAIGFAPDNGEGLVNRLRKSGLPLATCKELFLIDESRSGGGYFDKFRNRLMFPIYDERSQLVGFGGRLIGDGQPKYMNSSDTKLYRKSRVLYGLNAAKDTLAKTRKAVLVEGYLDVIACHRSGATGAVASLGTALAEDHAKLLKRYADEVAVLYDHDAAGQKAADRAIGILQAEGFRVKIVNVPEGDDPDTLLKRDGAEAVIDAIGSATSPVAFRIQKLELTLSPDQDQFWTEAVEILSDSEGDLEREGHLLRLAGKYPHIRDVQVALARLTKMVTSARNARRRAKAPESSRRPKPTPAPPDPLQSAETILFGALHDTKFQKFAWIALQTPELLATGSAIQLAQAVRQAFPSSPPEGPPVDWIHRIEPEEMRRLLSDISLNFHIAKLSEPLVVDSITRLRTQAIKRELLLLRQGNLSAEERQKLLERVKVLNPDVRSSPTEEDDPFS